MDIAMTQTVKQSSLYEQDMALWCADVVEKLREREFDRLDLEHLIEEIEGLANRDRQEIESRLDVLLTHLLKRLYGRSPQDYRGWENTIREQRKQIRRLLKYSPSLKNHLIDVFPEVWQDALEDVQANYPNGEFPAKWPFSYEIEEILTKNFWQE